MTWVHGIFRMHPFQSDKEAINYIKNSQLGRIFMMGGSKMAFHKQGKSTLTGILDKELDKTASIEDKKKKKEDFVKMDKPLKSGNKLSER